MTAPEPVDVPARSCRKCGRLVERAAGPGRPRDYCSTGCRRAREYELRRLQVGLEQVEEQLRWCRINRRGPSQLAKFDDERKRLEERLRELLDDGEGA